MPELRTCYVVMGTSSDYVIHRVKTIIKQDKTTACVVRHDFIRSPSYSWLMSSLYDHVYHHHPDDLSLSPVIFHHMRPCFDYCLGSPLWECNILNLDLNQENLDQVSLTHSPIHNFHPHQAIFGA